MKKSLSSNIQSKKMMVWIGAVLMISLLVACGGGGGGDDDDDTFTISGMAYPTPANNTDSDVNDPDTDFVRNNDFINPQEIENTTILGGYLADIGEGHEGQCKVTGDDVDVYRFTSNGNETIRIFLTEPFNNQPVDFTLYLDNGTTSPPVADSTLTVRQSGALSVPINSNGKSYFIEIKLSPGNAFSRYTMYKLYIGQFEKMAAAYTPNLKGDFVSHEAVVQFKKDNFKRSNEFSTDTFQPLGMPVKKRINENTFLLSFKEPEVKSRVFKTLGLESVNPSQQRTVHGDGEISEKRNTLQAVAALKLRDDIVSAEPHYIYKPFAILNDIHYSRLWNLDLINWEPAWEESKINNREVIVAVLDSGIIPNHPDLRDRILKDMSQNIIGYDFVSDAAKAGDGDGYDNDPTDPNSDLGYHGTHVAGTIAASVDNGLGISGVAWNAKIMPVRVISATSGSPLDIADGILWAAGLLESNTIPKPEKRADIINLSLGAYSSDPTLGAAIKRAIDEAGVVVIASSGNDNTNRPAFPASYEGVLSVGAVDINGDKAPYSNFGRELDIAAPGGDSTVDLDMDGYADGVLSTVGLDDYAYYSGTSMASPHVAGVIALMKGVASPGSLNPKIIYDLLRNGKMTRRMENSDWNATHGYGIIDAYKSMQSVKEGVPVVIFSIKPSKLQFSALDNMLKINVEKIGSEILLNSEVTSDVPWITCEKVDKVEKDNGQLWHISVVRDTLTEGIHRVSLKVVDTENVSLEYFIPVTVEVFKGTHSNVGNQTIMLGQYNEEDNKYYRIDEFKYSMDSHGQPFSFSKLTPGKYFIRSGSDINNDSIIYSNGEAFYMTDVLNLDNDMHGLDFFVGFSNNPFSNEPYDPKNNPTEF